MKIKQCIMDKVILSSNKSQHEYVFKDMSTIVNVCFQKTDTLLLPLNTHSPKELFLFLFEICFGEYYTYWCLFWKIP